MTPALYAELGDRYLEHEKAEDYRAALIGSVLATVVSGKAVTPAELLGEKREERRPSGDESVAEFSRAFGVRS